MSSIILICMILWNTMLVKQHEFHISKSTVEYVQDAEVIQITMHLFLDDLELGLEQKGWNDLHLCTKKESEEAEAHLVAYVKTHFELEVNNQKVNYEFLGKEISDDLAGVWCYFEVEGVEPIDKLVVHNSILTDLYEDQQNILDIRSNQSKGYFLLTRYKPSAEVKF